MILEYGLMISCILQCLVAGWLFKAARLREHVNAHSSWRVGIWWDGCVRYLVPAVLLVLAISALVKDLREPYGGYPSLALVLIGRDWLLLTLIAALFVAARPWRGPQ